MGQSLFRLIWALILATVLAAAPAHARYLQTDPIGYKDQQNLYAYVHNDPLNKVDPDGQQSEELMDRRNQALNQMGKDCEGNGSACAAMLADAVSIPLSLYPTGFVAGGGAFIARAVGVTRLAQMLAPAASRIAMTQRFNFARAAISTLERGGGKIIAGPGASKGAIFRDAGKYAERFGGKAENYAKVSVTGVTQSGERISVHAVKDLRTGRIIDEKPVLGR